MDRGHYDNLNLTVAQHPSETVERMVARILAFCLNAQEQLSFTEGLSTVNQPDIWLRSLDDQLLLWIDVGEPSAERIKKAARLSGAVKVYSFNSKSEAWWRHESPAFKKMDAAVFQFPWAAVQKLATFVQRTMDWSVTISDGAAFVATENGEIEITPLLIQEAH